jgi:hypothetical protein
LGVKKNVANKIERAMPKNDATTLGSGDLIFKQAIITRIRGRLLIRLQIRATHQLKRL